MRRFFELHDFIEVETPILSTECGGALAVPFKTESQYLPNCPLYLRIAPELYLKVKHFFLNY